MIKIYGCSDDLVEIYGSVAFPYVGKWSAPCRY